jgi:hypothetical protein
MIRELIRHAFPLYSVRWRLALAGNIGPSFRVLAIELNPLFGTWFGIRLDRIHRTLRLTHTAIDALVRVDNQHVGPDIETVDGANFYAIHMLTFDALVINDVRHWRLLKADRLWIVGIRQVERLSWGF